MLVNKLTIEDHGLIEKTLKTGSDYLLKQVLSINNKSINELMSY